MRKLAFSIGALAFAVMAVFAWSHTVVTPSQAGIAKTIDPTDMMSSYKGALPVERWDAI